MLGFSWKRFFITLGLGVVVWIISMFFQAFSLKDLSVNFSLLGSSCEITGYPVALCLTSNYVFYIITVYFINIFVWFWVIHLFSNFFWGWFEKRN